MSSGFITETEVVETRKRRQEEWEKVRKSDDPLERPDEPYDSRSLYDRLQEQKQKKDLEYEEAHKLKNMIKGLDDDEIEFLDLVDRTKMAADKLKNLEEEKELKDYRNRVATLHEKTMNEKMHSEINAIKQKGMATNKSSQTNLLKGVVVKPQSGKKHKLDGEKTDDAKCVKLEEAKSHNEVKKVPSLTCIGILPGLGCYNDSSSEEDSSDSEVDVLVKDATDMLGRKIQKKEKES